MPQWLNAQSFLPDTANSDHIINVDFGMPAWGDYDNDGDLDLLITGRGAFNAATTLLYENDEGRFSNVEVEITGLTSSSVTWGDYDNDGDLDIAIAGKNQRNQVLTQIWRNEGGAVFTDIGANLVGAQAGSIEWGDYDNDGDLDLLLAGNTSTNTRVSLVYRNVLDKETGERSFVDIRAGLIGVFLGNAVWGDYDNDGDLDILLTGSSLRFGEISRLYRNDQGVFVDTGVELSNLLSGNVSWGDYDNDGDLDILIVGTNSQSQQQARIYQNNDGAFSDIGADLIGVEAGEAAWVDFDNDGDLDVLTMGNAGSGLQAGVLFKNNEGFFTSSTITLPNLRDGAVSWGDYNNDGALDIAMLGIDTENGQTQTLLFKNSMEVPNQAPAPPAGLNASFEISRLTFKWDPSSDLETPAAGLTYNVHVDQENVGPLLIASMVTAEGDRTLPARGNATHNTSYFLDLDLETVAPSSSLSWRVQAVDPSFSSSGFSEPDVILLSGGVTTVEDVPEDQGRSVRVKWDASHLDVDPSFLTHYSVWRAVPDTINVASAILLSPADITPEFQGTAFRKISEAGRDTFWEWMGNVPAASNQEYAFVTSTLIDDTPSREAVHRFMLAAHTNDSEVFFDSNPASGFSLDNLAPQTPGNVMGILGEDGVLLSWNPSADSDFRHYLVFRGETEEFDISSAEAFAVTTEVEYLDNSSFAAGTFYYKVVAEDVNGNRSEASEPVSVVILTSTQGVDSEIPKTFQVHQNYPNPFNPSTLIRFDLPEAEGTRVVIYNAYGQQVDVLVDEVLSSGRHEISWRPNEVSSGVYFVQVATPQYSAMKRMVFIK